MLPCMLGTRTHFRSCLHQCLLLPLQVEQGYSGKYIVVSKLLCLDLSGRGGLYSAWPRLSHCHVVLGLRGLCCTICPPRCRHHAQLQNPGQPAISQLGELKTKARGIPFTISNPKTHAPLCRARTNFPVSRERTSIASSTNRVTAARVLLCMPLPRAAAFVPLARRRHPVGIARGLQRSCSCDPWGTCCGCRHAPSATELVPVEYCED